MLNTKVFKEKFLTEKQLFESPTPLSPQHSRFDLSPDVLEMERNILSSFGNRQTHLDCVRGSWLCWDLV